ncbi:hypothetical protein OKA05_14725 [Luteolibacter arcticus]|uniref:DUF695 domain-containing protein n=1 Tax=Luteolibacter arcticus TaxID=1581411 RepID=A0ABT3GJX9_9BACT|nr:hypothetical protein [Luteolibacter arcticus]MCW1923819.1 hypothetical protein [Luteolibacter arcticus]
MSFLSRLFGKGQQSLEHPQAPAEFTFNQRAAAFWDWFASAAEELRDIHNQGDRKQLPSIVSPKVDEFLPGMAWVFGPGTEKGFHSFTLSGEGVMYRQILADQWLKRLPGIENWTFYASRQPEEEVGDFTLVDDDLKFRPIEFWLTPEIDEEKEKVHLMLWHPLIEKAEERLCMQALFLVLDEILGEFGTTRWVGSIQFSQKRLAESMPITELKEFVEETRASRGWKMLSPVDTWNGYSIPPAKRSAARRMDTMGGSCGCFPVLGSFFDEPKKFEDPFLEMGAAWVYLSFSSADLPKGNEVEVREAMTDVIVSALEQDRSGIPLGGATGERLAYMDFLIFDGERSLARIREAARKAGVPADTRLEFLDSRRPGRPLFG